MSCFSEAAAYYVLVVQETDKAILCVNQAAAEEHDRFWVPKSRIDDHSAVRGKGKRGLLIADAAASLELYSDRTFDHSEGKVCSGDGSVPVEGEEDLFLETGLCSWCYQVEDNA